MPYNTLIALIGAGLLGALCGAVGVFAVLRRRALVGDAMAHAALPGIVVGFLLTGSRTMPPLLLGALASGLLGVGLLAWIARNTRTKPDAALAIVLSGFFGLGIALSRYVQNAVPDGSKAGLDSFLLGKVSGVVLQDVALIGLVSVAALGLILLAFKEFKLLTFDPAFARSLGWNTQRLDFLILGLITAAIVAGLPMAGVVLVAALTILPPLAARFWTHRLEVMVGLAAAVGAGSATIGVLVSGTQADLPTGPLIILTAGALFLFSAFVAPDRGVLAAIRRRRQLRVEVALASQLRRVREGRMPARELPSAWRDGDQLSAEAENWLRRYEEDRVGA